MHNSGSTLIQRYISRCANSVCFIDGTEGCAFWRRKKGQGIAPHDTHYHISRLLSLRPEVFYNQDNYNYDKIKELWQHHWAKSEEGKNIDQPVYFDKSPAIGIYMAEGLQRVFPDSQFLILMRDPYAVVEGTMRRTYGIGKRYPAGLCAQHWLHCAKQQIKNFRELEFSLLFTYEVLCEEPERIQEAIIDFVPQLNDIDLSQESNVWSITDKIGQDMKEIQSFNEQQFDNLKKQDVEDINSVLEGHADVLEFFGYERMEK